MHFEDSIDKIIKTGEKKDMEKIKDMFIELMDMAEEYDPDKYEDICYDLYETAFGKVLNREMAEEWVSSLRPEGRWTYADTEKIRNEYNLNIDPNSFYGVMNMMASDYGKVGGEDLDFYVKMTKLYINDEDAAPGKPFDQAVRARKNLDRRRR